MGLAPTATAITHGWRQLPTGDQDSLSEVVGQGLTAQDWIVAGSTLVGFIVAGRLLRTVVTRVVRKTDTEGAIARFVGRLAQNLVVLVGVVYALSVLEVQIGPLLGALGVTGIAVAFAMTAVMLAVLPDCT